jgi:N-acetylneuraminic acid mutarotase
MRFRTLPFLFLGLLSLVSIELAAQGSWEPRTAMPTGNGRWGAATFVIDGIGYTVGGYNGTTEINDVKAYDPATDSWQTRSPLPVAMRNAAGFALNGKGYVACGYSAAAGHFNSLYVYDPATNTWSTRPSFPGSARYGMASFVVNGIAYVSCGNSGAATGSYHADLYAYDPVANTWTQRAPYPGMERLACTGFAIGNKGYVFGGRRDDQAFSNELFEYDPATNTWAQRASLPATGRSYANTISAGGHGYVIAGSDQANAGLTDSWAYHQASDTWTSVAAYPGTGYWGGTAFTIGNRLFCGHGRFNTTIPTEFFELTSPFVGLPTLVGPTTLAMGPNPCASGGTLHLTLPTDASTGRLELVLHNALGQAALQQPLQGSGQVAVALPTLAPGAYTARLLADGRPVAHSVLVIGDGRGLR